MRVIGRFGQALQGLNAAAMINSAMFRGPRMKYGPLAYKIGTPSAQATLLLRHGVSGVAPCSLWRGACAFPDNQCGFHQAG